MELHSGRAQPWTTGAPFPKQSLRGECRWLFTAFVRAVFFAFNATFSILRFRGKRLIDLRCVEFILVLGGCSQGLCGQRELMSNSKKHKSSRKRPRFVV